MRFTRDLSEVSIRFLWDFHEISMRYLGDFLMIFLRYTWDWSDIFLRLFWDLPDIYLRFTWDMTERCLKDKCAVKVLRRYFCKNVTESMSHWVKKWLLERLSTLKKVGEEYWVKLGKMFGWLAFYTLVYQVHICGGQGEGGK